MTRRRTKPRSPTRTRKRKRKRERASRFRRYRGVAVTLLVATLACTLYLYVSVTARFGDRIWPIPSRVYSDVLVLGPGQRISARQLDRRLSDSGYLETTQAPARPGQFRNSGATIDVHLRAFVTPTASAPARRVRVGFSGGEVTSLRDPDGSRTSAVTVEPQLLATLYGPRQEERRLIHLEQAPRGFLQAVLAAEDSRFYTHGGLDLRGILRAGWANLREGRIVQGGSTITQQTVKNLYLGQQRTWWRKIREMAMSLILDARYTKDEILEVYLNEVYMGQNGSVAVCGVEAAARYYFGVPLGELSLGEWAVLAGMIRSPGRYNPFVHRDRVIERRGQVLQSMQRLGFIDAAEADAAAAEPLRLTKPPRARQRAPYAVDFVRAQVSQRYPGSALAAQGLKIYTSIDPRLQGDAETALETGLLRLEDGYPAIRAQLDQRDLQGAVVVTRPSDGAILAMVGGRDYADSQFNRAVQARRQPGSCFKPLVFAAGFELAVGGRPNGLTPASLLEDSPLEMVSGGKTWNPANYDKKFRGTVTVRQALEDSLNVPTVRAAQAVGLARVVDTAHDCGIGSKIAALPSVALGTAEVSPLELATAYGTFANGGLRISPWIVRALTDAEGTLLEGRRAESDRALSPQTAFLISDLLSGVLERGTARSAEVHGFRGRAAGKTGTTDDTRDSWFVGYTNDLLALVWVGYDDNVRTGLTGATGALPIWVDLMKQTAQDQPLRLREPEGIVSRKIDGDSGQLALSGCPSAYREHFVLGTEPDHDCPLHQGRFKQWLKKFLGGKGKKAQAGDGVPGV